MGLGSGWVRLCGAFQLGMQPHDLGHYLTQVPLPKTYSWDFSVLGYVRHRSLKEMFQQ